MQEGHCITFILVQFSLSAPPGICEGTTEDVCVVLETVIEREASADLTIHTESKL